VTVEAPFPESRLPEAIRELGDLRGNEYAWRRHDLSRVFDAAKAARLANLGGQVQFRLPDGTCELYWQNFDVASRGPDESWGAFVERSRADVDVAASILPLRSASFRTSPRRRRMINVPIAVRLPNER
jgi:hypothetical protein